MKTITFFSILLMTIINSIPSMAQGELDELSYTAYLKSSLPLWEKAINEKKKSINDQSSKPEKLEMTMLYYGYLSATMATQNEEAFESKLDQTKGFIERVIKEHPKWGEPKAVLSSVMGLQMAYSPFKGAFLGMKSGSYMSKAMKENPDSPIVMKLYAGSKQHTPALWGGDKKIALKYYQKVIDHYEQTNETINNWVYADALANVGIVYLELDEKTEAKEAFGKALAYEPDFLWVKKGLMPKVQNID